MSEKCHFENQTAIQCKGLNNVAVTHHEKNQSIGLLAGTKPYLIIGHVSLVLYLPSTGDDCILV